MNIRRVAPLSFSIQIAPSRKLGARRSRDRTFQVLITAELIHAKAAYVSPHRTILIRKISAVSHENARSSLRSERKAIPAAVGISKDNISKTSKSTHRECDSKVTCLSLIRTECSVIFAALKRVRTLAKVQRRARKCIQYLSNLPVRCAHETSIYTTPVHTHTTNFTSRALRALARCSLPRLTALNENTGAVLSTADGEKYKYDSLETQTEARGGAHGSEIDRFSLFGYLTASEFGPSPWDS